MNLAEWLTSLWLAPLWAFAVTQVAVFATSIYFHRAIAHGALRVHPVADVVFRTILWMTTGQRRQQWVAVHRKHHTFTDRAGDPHSPRLLGFWRVQLLNVYYYAREARNAETLRKFAPDVTEDWLDRLVFNHGWFGAAGGALLACATLGWLTGLLVAALHFIFYVFVIAPLINGLGHWKGQQNFVSNTAYNWGWLTWITGGEALHNNHHAFLGSPKFSMRRREFDPSWPVIRAMSGIGLVIVTKQPVAP